MENQNDKKVEAPIVDTPPTKSFVEEILEASVLMNEKPEEKATEETAPKPAEVNQETLKLQETIKNLVADEEKEVNDLKALLPNTQDAAKKLELEKQIFEKEKKIDKLKKEIDTPVVIDATEAINIIKEMNLPEGGETYKIVEKMKSQPKGAADLLKMFGMIAKAIKADSKVEAKPVDISQKPKDDGKPATQGNGIVDQILGGFNK